MNPRDLDRIMKESSCQCSFPSPIHSRLRGWYCNGCGKGCPPEQRNKDPFNSPMRSTEKVNLRRAMNIAARLMDYYNADEINEWLSSPHPQLEGQVPANLIQNGQFEPVEAILDRLDADAYI